MNKHTINKLWREQQEENELTYLGDLDHHEQLKAMFEAGIRASELTKPPRKIRKITPFKLK